MQNLGISIKNLKKVPAVSLGTQAGETCDDVIEIELDQEEENLQNLVNIPKDEDDIAIKQLLLLKILIFLRLNLHLKMSPY